MPRSWRGAALVAVSLALFIALATLNAGGYRYGASDQAFYVPAVQHHLDPSLFPRDWPMLAAQDRLNAFTPLAASMARLTGTSVPALFFSLYLAGLAALGAAAPPHRQAPRSDRAGPRPPCSRRSRSATPSPSGP